MLFFGIFSGHSQKSFDKILSEFSSHSDTINIGEIFHEKNYFAMMRSSKNFYLSRLRNSSCCNYIVFHIKSVGNLSLFGILSDYEFEDYENNQIIECGELLLYDSESNKCLLIDYSGMRGAIAFKLSSSSIVFSSTVNKYIGRLILMNEELFPESSIFFPSDIDGDANQFIRYDYSLAAQSCRKKMKNIKLDMRRSTYEDFIKSFELPIGSKLIDCDIYDNFLLYSFTKF
ncbi:MAG: hypothetical protein DI539_10950 [Flavobacterium psychrophilum]|nr:MAG: hypothetical protein DI539_10950 [Flavobacterium psychrophilum]